MSKKIKSKRNLLWESSCEDIWVTIEYPVTKTSHKFNICAIYLPPPVTSKNLDSFLGNCNRVCEITKDLCCIVGDFNLSYIAWQDPNTCPKTNMESNLKSFLLMNDLAQHNNVTNKNNNILDLVLAEKLICEVCPAADILSKVDLLHPPIEIHLKSKHTKTLPYNKQQKQLNFHKADYAAINEFLEGIPFKQHFDNLDVDDMVDYLYKQIWESINQYVPYKHNKKSKYPPWFNRCLINMLKEKNNIRIRFKTYKNPLDKISLNIIKKRCVKQAKDCYKEYLKLIEDSLKQNPKVFWSLVKGKRQGKSSYPATISDGYDTATKGEDICEYFATYFASVYDNSHANRPDSVLDSHSDSFGLMQTNIKLVLQKLKNLDTSKGSGPDGIPSVFIKNCASSLALPLCLIFNKSFESGTVPSRWKTAKVVPIFKGGEITSVKDYRPISLLCIFAKILESIISPVIQNHCKHFFTEHQHGFLQARSTVTNLVCFENFLSENIDSHNQADVIYTDFCKAFDKVSHNVLLSKLKSIGFSGSMLHWMESYLKNRKFYVVVNGYESSTFNISSGVPQGSHLGPILFNVFINNLPDCFNHSIPFLYADDLKIARVIKSSKDSEKLQEDLNNLLVWCERNGMQLNPLKCFYVHFTRNINVIFTEYFINNTALKNVNSIRDLGVNFDSKLTFVPHMEQMVKKASRILGFVIRNSRDFKNPSTKILLYNSLVRSIVEYASVVWRPHYATHILQIERLQKRFMWHLAFSVGKAKKLKSYDMRLKHFKMVTLEKRRDILDIVFLSKLLNGKINCPNLLAKINFRVPYNLPRRPITPLCPPLRTTVLGANAAIPRLCKILNKHSGSIDIFTDSVAKIKKHITSQE